MQTVTEGVVEKINEIFDDESWGGGESGGHRLSFLHHLQEQLHCSRQVTKLFTENYQAKCSSFPWMKSIKESLKVRGVANFFSLLHLFLAKKPPEIQAHLFPFMIPSRANDNLQSVMHKKLAPLVAGISESSDRSAAIKELEGFCQLDLLVD